MNESNLRRLRRAAGYHSAKAFAEKVGIPLPTYARYERSANGPGTPIPIERAWAIADALHCSIDVIVGRENTSAAEPRDDLQAVYDALSDEGRTRLRSYLGYLTWLDGREAQAARQRDEAHWDRVCLELEREFSAASSDRPFDYTPPATRRARFEEHVRESARSVEVQDGATREEQDAYAEEAVGKLMDAYDRMHPETTW